MNEIRNATVNINLNDGTINISGSEDFVEKNMEKVFEFVHHNVSTTTQVNKMAIQSMGTETNQKEVVSPIIQESYINKYIAGGVCHIDSEDDTISISKKVPGKSNPEKAKNIALIVLYIRNSKIQGKEIIPLCEKHGCYDQSNFSTWFKNEKTNIIRKGNGQNWTIELTQPGQEAAVKLLEEMINDKK